MQSPLNASHSPLQATYLVIMRCHPSMPPKPALEETINHMNMIQSGEPTPILATPVPSLQVFAGILIYSAYGLLTDDNQDEDDLADNAIVRFTKEFFPSTDSYDGNKFFTVQNQQNVATPLLLALVCVELSDVRGAMWSLP